MGAAYSLASHSLLSQLSYRTYVPLSRDITAHNGLSPLPEITHLEKCLPACPQPKIMETYSLMFSPL